MIGGDYLGPGPMFLDIYIYIYIRDSGANDCIGFGKNGLDSARYNRIGDRDINVPKVHGVSKMHCRTSGDGFCSRDRCGNWLCDSHARAKCHKEGSGNQRDKMLVSHGIFL